MSEKELTEEAIRLLRLAAAQPLPVDAGITGQLAHVVRDAWQAGRDECAEELAQAYCLFLDNDDLDIMRDSLTERLPDDWEAPLPNTVRQQ